MDREKYKNRKVDKASTKKSKELLGNYLKAKMHAQKDHGPEVIVSFLSGVKEEDQATQ